jgi:hypothetical protein
VRALLQVAGQVVSFMTEHLGLKIPSPAVMERIGTRLRRSVDTFARAHQIPLVKFTRGDRKIEVMRRYLDAEAATRRSGVAAIGYAQAARRTRGATFTAPASAQFLS